MISRPTTDQILIACSRELLDVVLPDVQSDHVRVTVQMLENVLRNAAARAAHEIAWMREETEALAGFARDVVTAMPERAGETVRALAALADAPSHSLELADVVETYSRAGEACSCALEAAMAEGDAALAGRAADLMAARNQRELQIMGEWTMVGRS